MTGDPCIAPRSRAYHAMGKRLHTKSFKWGNFMNCNLNSLMPLLILMLLMGSMNNNGSGNNCCCGDAGLFGSGGNGCC